MSSEKLQKGQLVKIKLGAVNWTSDGFATIGGSNNKASLFEFIDLATYPSFNDFLGSSYSVDNKSVATILKYVGRPFKISKYRLVYNSKKKIFEKILDLDEEDIEVLTS